MSDPPFPGGRRGAVSLTYDDGLNGHLDAAMPDLGAWGLRGTFYVTTRKHPADAWHARSAEWAAVAGRGHEVANHTRHHPCSRKYHWVKKGYALEDYDLARMEGELRGATDDLREVLGDGLPTSFAYTCCEDWVGEGEAQVSYRELAGRLFPACRGGPRAELVDPAACDFAFVPAWMLAEADPLDSVLAFLDRAATEGKWAVLMFHGVGGGHTLNVTREAHRAVCAHVAGRAADLWCDTFVGVANHLRPATGRGWRPE